jgi:hypothetical protein
MASVISLVLGIINTIFRGYLIKTFWAWFILSQFQGLPSLSILGAIGLSCFVGIMTPWRGLTGEEKHMDSDERSALTLLNSAIYTLAMLISWGVAAIVHAMM